MSAKIKHGKLWHTQYGIRIRTARSWTLISKNSHGLSKGEGSHNARERGKGEKLLLSPASKQVNDNG